MIKCGSVDAYQDTLQSSNDNIGGFRRNSGISVDSVTEFVICESGHMVKYRLYNQLAQRKRADAESLA